LRARGAFTTALLARRSDSHVEALLDQALEATFPASDPVALTQPGG